MERLSALVASGSSVFDFTTAGSSGKSPESLLRFLAFPVFQTRVIVDIRANPTSQHTPHWNKGSISDIARKQGVEYVHRPDLGVPVTIRSQLHHEQLAYPDFFAWYDANVAVDTHIGSLKEILSKHPVFLCTELGPTFCHRHRLALALEKRFGLVSFDI